MRRLCSDAVETATPVGYWFFLGSLFPTFDGLGAIVSSGGYEDISSTLTMRIDSAEPESEDAMNRQDEEDGQGGQNEDDDDGLPDSPGAGSNESRIRTWNRWIIYRPNTMRRQQVLYCPIWIDPNNQEASYISGVRRCWPTIDPFGLQRALVHNSVLQSATCKGAELVFVGDDRGDGRYLLGGNLRIVVEVQIYYFGDRFTTESYGRYAPWRSDFAGLFSNELWHRYCEDQQRPRCYGFVNGAFKPWTSIVRFNDADFVAIQVHRRETIVHGEPVQHFQEEDENVFEDMPIPKQLDLSCDIDDYDRPRSAIVFRPREPIPGVSPYWTIDEYNGDGQMQQSVQLRPCWGDLWDLDTWSILIPHAAVATSTSLQSWDRVYIIDHRSDQQHGHVLVLIEIVLDYSSGAGPTMVRAEWLPSPITPHNLIRRADREQACARSGITCQMIINGRPVSGTYPYQLQSGDFVVLHVIQSRPNSELAVQPWKPQATWTSVVRPRWPVWWVLTVDLLAFLGAFGLLCLRCGQRKRRLRVVGQCRHSVTVMTRHASPIRKKKTLFLL